MAGGSPVADRASQLEAVRKMLLAMVQDVRVVLIKLADQTQTLRYLAGRGDDQARSTAPRAIPSSCSRRSPTGWGSGSSNGSWRTWRSAAVDPIHTRRIAPASSTRSAPIVRPTSGR